MARRRTSSAIDGPPEPRSGGLLAPIENTHTAQTRRTSPRPVSLARVGLCARGGRVFPPGVAVAHLSSSRPTTVSPPGAYGAVRRNPCTLARGALRDRDPRRTALNPS
eukprot:4473222-Prymnesium_polylepis.1